MKVYAWIGFRGDVGAGLQSREIVAAKSKAEVGRLTGTNPRALFNLSETGSPEEVDAALARPGIVLYRGLDDRHGEWKASDD